MFTLPDKLTAFTPYEPLTGEYPIRLDVNESYFTLPTEQVVRSVMDIDKIALNRYPDPYSSRLINAFADLFELNPQNVVAGNGSDELIGLIMAGLLSKGDKVLTLSHDFSMYAFYARLHELNVDTFYKEDNFEFDVNALAEYVNTNGVKCVVFSNPCNPTSLGVVKQNVMQLVKSVKALVIVDEAYMDFWTEDGKEYESVLSEAASGNHNNLIVLRTCSKSVALAGLRIGFAVSNGAIIRALNTVKSPFNVNALSQAIGTAILSDKVGYRQAITHIKQSTEDLCFALLGLARLGIFTYVYRTRTNFVFAEMECDDTAQSAYDYLLTKGIAVRRFGRHLRICAGTRDEMNALVKALSQWQIERLGGELDNEEE